MRGCIDCTLRRIWFDVTFIQHTLCGVDTLQQSNLAVCCCDLNCRYLHADMGNEQSSPLQQAAAHDDIDKVHVLIAQNRIELNGTDKVTASMHF